MLTAVDTNVISALWSKEPASANVSASLFKCRGEGGLIIAAPVYIELLAYPKATRAFLDTFLTSTNIQVDFTLEDKVWLKAGEAFADYAARRQKAKDGQPKRLLVDFLVGAHAFIQADRLLTLDKSRYQKGFPKLTMI